MCRGKVRSGRVLFQKYIQTSRHGLVGRGVQLFGIILLALNFLDGFYKLAKLDWHAAYQIVMTLFYFVLSVRLVQLILAFRGE